MFIVRSRGSAQDRESKSEGQTFKVEKFDIKGDGGTDYVAVDSSSGRVFVSRQTHVMVVEGATGKVVGDIANTPGVHGAAFSTKANHGFTTNSGDQTVTMFDVKTLAVLKQIKVGPGLDGTHGRRSGARTPDGSPGEPI